MKEWTEVIRDARFFNLLVTNTKSMDTDISFTINTRGGEITVQYDSIFRVKKFDMPNPPDWIAVSDAHSHATPRSTKKNIVPHAEDPAPAQSAGNVAFIWGKDVYVNGFIEAHREDGFPAVVIATGLHKHYTYGKLNRKKQYPAIKAEHLAALWSEKPGSLNRGCGPKSVAFENYKEFWIDGEFKGHRWSDYFLGWNPRLQDQGKTADENALTKFLDNLNGTTNMFSDVFFADEEDEVCYITDFA